MQPAGAPLPRHIVIFDCNVYLDVACLVGPPFTWDKFDATAARLSMSSSTTVPIPTVSDSGRVYPDSLRALALCTSGNFAGAETLHVGVNDSIQGLVYKKAVRVLAWSEQDAATLLTEMITGLVDLSDGHTIAGHHYPEGNPPLDHEDGMVFGACSKMASEDPLAHVYCVTRDKPFIEAHNSGLLASHTKVLSPPRFVSMVRAARNPARQMARRQLER